jgi:hypothetical protein
MAQAMVEGLKGKALLCSTAHTSAGLTLVSLPLILSIFTPRWVEPPSHLLQLGPSTCGVLSQCTAPETEAQRVGSLNQHQLSMNLLFTQVHQAKGTQCWPETQARSLAEQDHVDRLGPLRKKTDGLAAGPGETPSWALLPCDHQWALSQSSAPWDMGLFSSYSRLG